MENNNVLPIIFKESKSNSSNRPMAAQPPGNSTENTNQRNEIFA